MEHRTSSVERNGGFKGKSGKDAQHSLRRGNQARQQGKYRRDAGEILNEKGRKGPTITEEVGGGGEDM